MKRWEPQIGLRLEFSQLLSATVLRACDEQITLGFVGTDPVQFAMWAKEHRQLRGFFCSIRPNKPMLVMRFGVGERIQVADGMELRVALLGDSQLQLLLQPSTQVARSSVRFVQETDSGVADSGVTQDFHQA